MQPEVCASVTSKDIAKRDEENGSRKIPWSTRRLSFVSEEIVALASGRSRQKRNRTTATEAFSSGSMKNLIYLFRMRLNLSVFLCVIVCGLKRTVGSARLIFLSSVFLVSGRLKERTIAVWERRRFRGNHVRYLGKRHCCGRRRTIRKTKKPY